MSRPVAYPVLRVGVAPAGQGRTYEGIQRIHPGRDPEPRNRSVGPQRPQYLRRAAHENGPAKPGDLDLNPGSIDFISLMQ
ncbi:hypothetical protein GCM10010317_033650 [Streptomyces mirabilis]|nr:hypothetical protein GCM10010317_033650 [Streptomyces mirabilis]